MITIVLLFVVGITLLVLAAIILVGQRPRSSRIVIKDDGTVEVRK